ncbi:MAG: hypothetical protein IPL33_10155 [Sphingobacteriales bacterium]|nr:hypothetical protein [Sphingobacteriales bacterium]
MKHWILLLMLFAVASTSVAVAQDVGISNIVHTPATPSASRRPRHIISDGYEQQTRQCYRSSGCNRALASELSYVSDDGEEAIIVGPGLGQLALLPMAVPLH